MVERKPKIDVGNVFIRTSKEGDPNDSMLSSIKGCVLGVERKDSTHIVMRILASENGQTNHTIGIPKKYFGTEPGYFDSEKECFRRLKNVTWRKPYQRKAR
jgi:hypothetical protein